MDRTFQWKRPDGTAVSGELGEAMDAAGRQVVVGEGTFNVVRGEYSHPGLERAKALKILQAILSERLDVDERVSVRAQAVDRVVFAVKRVEPVADWRNPLRDAVGVFGLRQDQGVDYGVRAPSPVYAIGPGVVTVYRTDTGWPWGQGKTPPDDHGAYIAIKLDSIPDGMVAKDLYVYDAERIILNRDLNVGSRVDADTVIAVHQTSFANCEMGWAAPQSNGYDPLAQFTGGYTEGHRTWAGDDFDKMMRLLGAPDGLVQGRDIDGHAPANWPVWGKLL